MIKGGDKVLSSQLKKYRSVAGLSQAELAKMIGLSQQAIARWETEKSTPDPDTLIQLSSIFGITVDELLGKGVKIKKGVKIPILGSVVAGIPVSAITDILGYEEITAEKADKGEHFALKVKGESMSPYLMPGDIVIVREQPDVESGEMAIVLINGDEATVKRVKKTTDGIILYGYNNIVYQPHEYSNEEIESLPIRIIGRVVEIRREP